MRQTTNVIDQINASVDEVSSWLHKSGNRARALRHAADMHARGELVEDVFIGNRWLTIVIDPSTETLSVVDATVLRGAWEQVRAAGRSIDSEL